MDLSSFLPDLRPPALGGTHIHTPVEVLDVAAGGGITPAEFAARYDALNRPVLLRGAMANWPVDGE